MSRIPTTDTRSISQSFLSSKPILAMSDKRRLALRMADRLEGLCRRGDGLRYLYGRRAERMRMCGTQVCAALGGDRVHVIRANWCRDRLCPLCAWRRSRRNAAILRRAIARCVRDRPSGRWIMITLTIPSLQACDLSHGLTCLTRGWDILRHRRAWQRAIIGAARSIEITRSTRTGLYHPHLHAIIEVPAEYYTDAYIPHSLLLDWWIDAQEAITSIRRTDLRVHIQAIDTPTARGPAEEASKYVVKGSDLLVCPDDDLDEIAAAVHGRRLVAYTGTIRMAIAAEGLTDDPDALDADITSLCATDDLPQYLLRWSAAGSAYYVERRLDDPRQDHDLPDYDSPSLD